MPIPAVGDVMDSETWLQRIDGVLFTGSHSNVEPYHYAGVESEPGTLHDSQRDATTLPLMRLAVATGVPVLAVCRGFQEMNVAFGGSLHQKVQDLPGHADHRENTQVPLERQYEPAHPVRLTRGGLLQSLLGTDRVQVNSLHAQGVDRLAPPLVVEATAPDGLVEAVRVRDADAFAVGVQWHPEWRPLDNPMSRALFAAFGEACRLRARSGRSAA
jgi:putative glutamine amidotransferase